MGNVIACSFKGIIGARRGRSLTIWALVVLSFICTWLVSAEAATPLLHNSANLGTKYGTWGTAYDCSTCHNATTSNIKRVNQSITTPLGSRPVVFSKLTSTVDNAGVFGDDLRAVNANA